MWLNLKGPWGHWSGGWLIHHSIVCLVRAELVIPHMERYRVVSVHTSPELIEGSLDAGCMLSS